MRKTTFFLVLFGLCFSLPNLFAQNTVTGTVTDADGGMPLPGATVLEEGTTNGAATDFDGNYTINVEPGATLLFSMIGFTTQNVVVDTKSTIDVLLVQDAEALDEVVITALGIKRERKSLGYALQEVGGDQLVESRENNVANAFAGKVSGLQVIRGSNGPASSSKIVLRGNNSLTGDNQPLVVVDGIPMDNFTGASNNDFFNPSIDRGNGLGDLSPENIQSISVLKGASAAALYGSRAGNGVILVTTKSGKKTDGLGISYSNTTGFANVFISPELQDSYGQGTRGVYNELSELSWGPRIEGQIVTNAQGQKVPLRSYNNLNNYLDVGVNQTHSLSFQQQVSNGTSLYSSASYLNDESMIPGAELDRLNLLTRATSVFGKDDNWTTDIKAQYIRSTANNRPLSGANPNNVFTTLYLLPRSLDIRDYSAAVDDKDKMIWYSPGTRTQNPYWSADYSLNMDKRDRYLLNASLKHDFNDWLNAEVKAGGDLYTTNIETKLYGGSLETPSGRYSLGKETFSETNYSFLVNAAQDNIFGKFGGSVTLGGNLMERRFSSLNVNAGELEVPNLFTVKNSLGTPSNEEKQLNRKINSLYGTVQFNYDGYIFVDLTGRNDWSSTLSEANRSFFYPSVSTSIVVTDLIKRSGGNLPSWFSYGKIRASYAEVGNDLDPYELYNTFYINNDPNSNTIAGRNPVKYDPNVKSELIKSKELGLEARFLNGRLAFDFSYYRTNATNQLINLPMNPLSGYQEYKANAGDIQNEGVELMLNGRILDNPDGLTWDLNVNYSRNSNTIKRLTEDSERFKLGGFDNITVFAIEKGGYGEIYGSKFKRVEDAGSPFFGQIELDGDGLPLQQEGDAVSLGNQQPDALIGFGSTFSYKNVSFGFLVDARIGGEIFSGTNRALQSAGSGAATVINGQRAEFVVPGAVQDDSGNFSTNTTPVTSQNYWSAITSRSGNLGITEANIYDATNVRLRTVNLRYDFTANALDRTPFEKAYIGLSATNVWMITSHLNGVDPESVYATNTNAVGFENSAPPTTRTIFFNFGVSF